MKMKQVLATGVALSMALSMAPVTASAADKVDINVIAAQYGQQTADWWANFVTEFNEANPDINLNVEVVSWNDIYTVVNTRIANGEAPDVLNIDVFADYQADDLLLPIQDVVSEETYSKMYDAFLAQSEVDGTVWAIPDLASARAMYYNKDILDKAGIDPSTLTSPDAIKEAFETIDSKKDELGLTAVVGYAAEPVNLYWSTGNHLFGNYLDSGLDRDDTTYIDMLNDGGKVDEDRLTDFANFVGLLNQYSDPALLVSGTYDQQILNFSSGKYAFVTQGSWIGATMTGDDADAYKEAGNFEVGMIPYAFEDGIDTILTNSPSWWSVYKDGNVEAAEAFLQWLTTDEAQEVLVKEAGFVSPFKSCTIVGDDPFAQTITDYVSAGKTSAWHWLEQKEGLAQNYTGQVFADYASGSLDEAGFVKTLEQVIQGAYAN